MFFPSSMAKPIKATMVTTMTGAKMTVTKTMEMIPFLIFFPSSNASAIGQ